MRLCRHSIYKKKVADEMEDESGKSGSKQVSHDDDGRSSGDDSDNGLGNHQNEESKPEKSGSAEKATKPNSSPKRRRRRSKDAAPMSFPQKLMEILSNGTHSDIISWLPHGRGFMIYQKKRFAAEVMPKYFKQSKFTSFTRKLNRWNFTRITRGPETGAYYHDLFRRGEYRLCMQMCCQATKNQELQQQEQTAANQVLVANPTVSDPRWGLSAGLSRIEDMVKSTTGDPTTAGATSASSATNDKPAAQASQVQGGLAELLSAAATGAGTTVANNLLRQYQLDAQRPQQRLILQQAEQTKQQQEDQIAAILRSQQEAALLSHLAAGGLGRGTLDVAPAGALQLHPNTYIAMLMAQEKARAQLTGSAAATPGAILPSVDNLQFQASLLQAQQQQQRLLQQQLTHQRLLQAVAMRQKDQAPTSRSSATPAEPQAQRSTTQAEPSQVAGLNSVLGGGSRGTAATTEGSEAPSGSSVRNPAA